MSGTTTELGLPTAVDGDDNADYLTISLKQGLQTVDALFNNITGHNHGASHQGGPIVSIPITAIPDGSITSAKIADNTITGNDIAPGSIGTAQLAAGAVTSAKIAAPIDIGGWFRSTAPGTLPTTGAGLELYYDGNQAVVQGYDRGGAAFKPLTLVGSPVNFVAANKMATLDSGGIFTIPGSLTLNSLRGANQGGVNLHASAVANDVQIFAENGNLYMWLSNTGGQLLIQGGGGSGWVGASMGSLGVNGNASVTGNLAVTNQLNVGGTLAMVRGRQLVWTDGNSSVWTNTDNNMYFDTYNAGWNFRNTAAGSVVRFVIDASGNVQIGGSFTAAAGNATISGSLSCGSLSISGGNLSIPGTISAPVVQATNYFQVGTGAMPGSGGIRLTAGTPIYWSSGDQGIWFDSSGYMNIKEGQALAGGASGGGGAGIPTQCRGFLQVQISGVGLVKIPCFNN